MADVMSAFLSGHQAGQAESAHAQQLEENKLRTLVLKHEIDRMKIDDQLRARDLQHQNLQFLQGQPAADIPSDTVTSQKPNLPSRSLAGVVMGMQPGAASTMQGGAEPAAAEPATLPVPSAQAAIPETHPETTRVARSVNIPGVPSLGVGDVNVRPRSLEDLIRSRIAEEMTKPYTLAPGARRLVGSDVVGEGGPQMHSVGAGGLVATGPDGKTTTVVPGRQPAASEFQQFKDSVYPLKFGKRTFAELTPAQQANVVQSYANERRDPSAAADRKDRTSWEQDFREYQSHVSQLTRKHQDAVRGVLEKNKTAVPGEEGDIPDFAPPSFEEWRSTRPAKPAKGGAAAAGAGGPARRVTTSANGLSVTVDGRTFQFPDKTKADAFRKELGLQ